MDAISGQSVPPAFSTGQGNPPALVAVNKRIVSAVVSMDEQGCHGRGGKWWTVGWA